MKAIGGLFQSRKAVLVILLIAVLTALLVHGDIKEETFASLLKFVIPAWLGSHAYEEGKKSENGGGKLAAIADAIAGFAKLAKDPAHNDDAELVELGDEPEVDEEDEEDEAGDDKAEDKG